MCIHTPQQNDRPPPIFLVIIVIECNTLTKAIKYCCKHTDTWKNLLILIPHELPLIFPCDKSLSIIEHYVFVICCYAMPRGKMKSEVEKGKIKTLLIEIGEHQKLPEL